MALRQVSLPSSRLQISLPSVWGIAADGSVQVDKPFGRTMLGRGGHTGVPVVLKYAGRVGGQVFNAEHEARSEVEPAATFLLPASAPATALL